MSTDTPLYLRIAEDLRGLIGDLPAGTQLPSISELNGQYGGSSRTPARAYKVLIEDGLVISRHGAGYFVRGADSAELLVRQHRRRSEDSPFGEGAARQGAVGTWRPDSITEEASETVAERLGIEVGAAVMHTSYVYLADDQPVQLAESWEPLALTGQSLIALPEVGPYAGVGVAARMRVLGIEVGDPVERVRARQATRQEAQALGMTPPGPVLAIERTYYDQATGRPVETADVVMRGDRWVAVYGQAPTTG